jgi:hypothetical protein
MSENAADFGRIAGRANHLFQVSWMEGPSVSQRRRGHWVLKWQALQAATRPGATRARYGKRMTAGKYTINPSVNHPYTGADSSLAGQDFECN